MSFATTRRDIENRFNDNWATTVIAWDNVAFSEPSDEYWCRFSIKEGASPRQNIGGAKGRFRNFGQIFIQIYAPNGEGTQIIRSYADTISAIFRDARFSGIVCQEAEITNIGLSEKHAYYQANVTVPYYVDAVYTATA